MKAILYDGDQEISMAPDQIDLVLNTKEVVLLYQTTLIYHDAIREFLKECNDLTLLSRKREVEIGIELLYRRLARDLGEDQALHFMAKTSLSIILS